MEEKIVFTALEHLKESSRIEGSWTELNKAGDRGINGTLEFKLDSWIMQFHTEIKREIRPHLIPYLVQLSHEYPNLLIVAETIYPKVKAELRERKIAYLEASGNLFIDREHSFVWIDGNKPVKVIENGGNRAFTKTGLRVIFQFLINNNYINRPYREISENLGVGLGTVTNIIRELKADNFIINLTKTECRLVRKGELLQKWVGTYEKILKPSLLIGTFGFVKKEDFLNWQTIRLSEDRTWWGGEPAADLLTHYLKPQELTLYTLEDRKALIKQYRLLPAADGNIKVYKAFWDTEDKGHSNTVHPLLVYADLINTGDRRSAEAAQKVYDGYLQTDS